MFLKLATQQDAAFSDGCTSENSLRHGGRHHGRSWFVRILTNKISFQTFPPIARSPKQSNFLPPPPAYTKSYSYPPPKVHAIEPRKEKLRYPDPISFRQAENPNVELGPGRFEVGRKVFLRKLFQVTKYRA